MNRIHDENSFYAANRLLYRRPSLHKHLVKSPCTKLYCELVEKNGVVRKLMKHQVI